MPAICGPIPKSSRVGSQVVRTTNPGPYFWTAGQAVAPIRITTTTIRSTTSQATTRVSAEPPVGVNLECGRISTERVRHARSHP